MSHGVEIRVPFLYDDFVIKSDTNIFVPAQLMILFSHHKVILPHLQLRLIFLHIFLHRAIVSQHF